MSYVTTTELQNGDIVLAHGAKLKLSNRKDHGIPKDNVKGGNVVTFHVEMIDGQNGSIPMHWLTATEERDRYTLQGNNYAMWKKED